MKKQTAKQIQEYAYYVQRHAEYETSLQCCIEQGMDLTTINRHIACAQWAAKSAKSTADILGLSEDLISSNVMNRYRSAVDPDGYLTEKLESIAANMKGSE